MLIEMKENDFIISKTNLQGNITYTNEIFMEMAGYTEAELLGKPHNIVRHPDTPKAIFKYFWNTLQKNQEVFAFVVNKTKTGDSYWVFANVTSSVDSNSKTIGYYSVRRKPSHRAIQTIIPIYKEMLELEKTRGVDASFKFLTDILDKEGVCYEEFIINLQKS